MTFANQTREEGNEFSKEMVAKIINKLKRAITTYIDDSAKMEVNLPSLTKKKVCINFIQIVIEFLHLEKLIS